jgi:cobalt-zinc-cadmium resistance protein CzcA
MIERLIDLALRFRIVVIAAVLLLVVLGTWAFATINFDAYPDLTPNQVLVMTEAPGLSANEVENLISFPLETELLGLPRTEGVRSISKPGVSVVTVTFEDDVDIYFARAQVQQRVQDVARELSGDFHPILGPPSTVMGEAFQYLVESDSLSLIELRNLNEYVIKPRLRTIPSVAEINTWGGMVQQFQVLTDPSKLSAYGVTLAQLQSALAANNDNFGAGYIEDRGERLRVRGLVRVTNGADIGKVVVATRSGTPIDVRDVAAVSIGAAPREGAVTRDARGEAVGSIVVLVKGANTREVVREVVARLEEVAKALPPTVRVRAHYNQGEVIERTTRTVLVNLLEGALLVTLVLVLFLRNTRAALLTASVIPLSMLFAFLAMKRLGISVNLMSLGALDFGLIVDASVVMVENFVRKLDAEQPQDAPSRTALIRAAAYEVARPIVFGVCIIIAVYVPILTLQGLEGRMFHPMAITVCIAVLGSLFLALTYVPAVASVVLQHVHEKHPAWFERLRVRYLRGLDWALTHPRNVILSALAVLMMSFASVPFLGTEFMPRLDEGVLMVETRRTPSIALPEAMAISTDVERTLKRFPEVRSIVTNLGRPDVAIETMGLYDADVYVLFKPRSQWKAGSLDELVTHMDSALAEVPGLSYQFSAPMAMRLDEMSTGVRTQLGIKIFGDSLPLLQERAEEIRQLVERIDGAEDVSVRVSTGALQVEINFDRDALARFGLNVADVRESVQGAINGVPATEVIDGRRRFPVVVKLSEAYRRSPDALGQLLITTPGGARVTLSQVASIDVTEGQETIDHESGQRLMVVQSNVRGRDLGGFVAEVRRTIGDNVKFPTGYFVDYSGQFENQERATRRLLLIVPAVLFVILAFLYAAFGNGRQALVVMLNVPFAAIGGIAALWLRGLNLSLSASVGFIALFGVAVLNGVVLMSYIKDVRAGGESLRDAVRLAAETRLRPVLMTALVAGVGFLPMAVSTSQGAEVQRPLATVVIGGLITSTLLTLIVLPVVYEAVEERWPKASNWLRRSAASLRWRRST